MHTCNNNTFDKNMKHTLSTNTFYHHRFMCLKDHNIIIISHMIICRNIAQHIQINISKMVITCTKTVKWQFTIDSFPYLNIYLVTTLFWLSLSSVNIRYTTNKFVLFCVYSMCLWSLQLFFFISKLIILSLKWLISFVLVKALNIIIWLK